MTAASSSDELRIESPPPNIQDIIGPANERSIVPINDHVAFWRESAASLFLILLAELQRAQHLAEARGLDFDAVVVIVLEIERDALGFGELVQDSLIELEDAAHGGLVHDLPLGLLHDVGVVGAEIGLEDVAC